MKKIIIIIISLFVGFFFNSCNNEKILIPKLPPTSSFFIDFSDFNNNKLISETSKLNWGHAAHIVFAWDTIITKKLAIPIASYNETLSDINPFYQGDGVWVWEYSFTNQENIYSARLLGTVEENSIYWEMFISKDGEFNNFKWYTGTSFTDNSKVSWKLFNKPDDATELLSIEYNKISENLGNITFTNIAIDTPENGAYIKYGNNNEEDYTYYYQVYNKGEDNLINIVWNQLSKNGRISDILKFKDTKWHCWNENKEDLDCNN